MNLQSAIIFVALSVLIPMLDAERSVGDKMLKLRMTELYKTTARKASSLISNMERKDNIQLQNTFVNGHDTSSRNKRLTSSSNVRKIRQIHLSDIDMMYSPINVKKLVTDLHEEKIIKKRHACRGHHNRRNRFRFYNVNYSKYRDIHNNDSSEESEEMNTEDPVIDVTSAENISPNKQTVEVPNEPRLQTRLSSNERRGNHDSKHENHNDDSGESADKEEFIFTNVPRTVSTNSKKSNRSRGESNNKQNRYERGVIEEENVATTASGFKFTSGNSDFGSNVAFGNINV